MDNKLSKISSNFVDGFIMEDGTEYEYRDTRARSSIGDISTLNTTNKDNVVGSINEIINDYATKDQLNKKITAPDEDGTLDQFLVSNGAGKTKWKTVINAEEEMF